MSPKTYTYGHLMKIEWFVANVTAVGSPDRVEHAIWEVILVSVFLSVKAIFVAREPLCDVETPSLALVTLLRVI